MPGRIFVTGASGFVGSAVVNELVARDYQVSALVRHVPPGLEKRALVIKGDILDAEILENGIKGCDAVIHLVGIIRELPHRDVTFEKIHFEGTKSVVDAASRAGVKRYVHMSALGTRAEARSDYHRTKYFAEQYVRHSPLEWTIIRPSLIHGPGGEFMQQAARWARGASPPFLFMPYFGGGLFGFSGAGKLQPVFVNDVARAFVDCIENRKTVGEVYLLGGPDEITWPQMHRTIAQNVVGKTRFVAPIPAWYANLLARFVPASLLPFNQDQVIMSQEDNTCDISKFTTDFGWTPQGFEQSLRSYVASL